MVVASWQVPVVRTLLLWAQCGVLPLATYCGAYEGILHWLAELLRAELHGIRRLSQAIVAGILFADKVHNFAPGRMRDTMRVPIIASMMLFVTNKFIISIVCLSRKAVRCSAPDRTDHKVRRTSQVIRCCVFGRGSTSE